MMQVPIITLDSILLLLAIGVLLWGFERYRSRFVKSDLFAAVIFAGGLLAMAFAPGLFGILGGALDIQQRPLVMSMAANLGLLTFLLYVSSVVQNVRGDLSELTRNLVVDDAPMTDGGRESIYVVIPAYNEAETIKSVVQSLPDRVRGHYVQPVVVSDGSADNTAERARYNGTIVVEHPLNQGQGGALKTGFEIAQRDGAAVVVTMDGDGQHPVEELDRLVSPIVDGEADYVMGSRHIGQDESGNSIVRQSGIRFFTVLINVLTKADITDCTNGYRAIRGSELDELTLTEERFSAPELIIEARKNGLRIKELPIMIKERQAGETKKPQIGYAVGLTRAILISWLR
ncbi:glycosyltransferase family 2 protein [Halostella sp. PRR32]|uniref:glycosyltransferase family 2 protein n=1 Tax=Halostella sp. PRR32 TaxID=3098147 RepID=UPI0034E0CBDC